eukprot:SAG22_NODE_99_length_20560_cov_128.669029_6_plen_126_part_00
MNEDQNNISANIEDVPEPIEAPSEPIEDAPVQQSINEDEEDTQLEKPKKPRSEKQIQAFAKAQEALRAKRAAKKKEKEALRHTVGLVVDDGVWRGGAGLVGSFQAAGLFGSAAAQGETGQGRAPG